ncbi:MAG: response regulator transcription factor [bacterium]|nr:response regulator transcription factor [bacterium]
MSPRVLIVEDEPDIVDVVSYNLRQAGVDVDCVGDGNSALKHLETHRPDLIILDLMLPGIDGLEFCRLLKQRPEQRDIPIMMLTAKAEEVDRIVGLELGADDYVTKPFSPRELVLRVKAILRRADGLSQAGAGNPSRLSAGPIALDPQSHHASVDGADLTLTATEFKLLQTLMERRGRVQSREELLNVVWGYQYAGYGRTVDTHVRRLREKLGTAHELVETVRGVGYRFRRDGA